MEITVRPVVWVAGVEPTDLDALRAWAEECYPLDDVARLVRHLFEEWDAANRECEELRAQRGGDSVPAG